MPAAKDELLNALRQALANTTVSPQHPLLIAYSGGMDSTLLLWCAQLLWPGSVRAIHVNHGLQAEAANWAEQCQRQCRDWAVPVTVACPTLGTGASVEAQARAARYQAFTDALGPQQKLLLAHHRDDQLETLLFRLLRGSGVDGLAGMPAQRALGRGELLRPWLDLPHRLLQQAAREWQLTWIDDPSNRDRRFERNFIRHDLLPLLRQRWPSADEALARSQRHLAHAAERLGRLDSEALGRRLGPDGSLDITGLDDPVTGMALLRHWLHGQGVERTTERQLHRLWHDVVHSAPDTQGQLQRGVHTVRRYRDRLHVLPTLSPLEPSELVWDPRQERQISASGWGELTATEVAQAERARCLDKARVDRALEAAPVHVQHRQGGEYLHAAGRRGGRDLKRLLQELGLPPWWRARVPLLYWQDQLIAVADLVVAHEWQAEAGTAGYRLHWKKAPSHTG